MERNLSHFISVAWLLAFDNIFANCYSLFLKSSKALKSKMLSFPVSQ